MVMTEYTITLKAHNKIVEAIRNSNGPDVTRLIKKYQNQTNEISGYKQRIKELQELVKKEKNLKSLQLPYDCFVERIETYNELNGSFFKIIIIANTPESVKYFYDIFTKKQ